MSHVLTPYVARGHPERTCLCCRLHSDFRVQVRWTCIVWKHSARLRTSASVCVRTFVFVGVYVCVFVCVCVCVCVCVHVRVRVSVPRPVR